jgi:hypothetical protein
MAPMSSSINGKCKNCGKRNDLSLDSILGTENLSCFSCYAYALPTREIRSVFLIGIFSLCWIVGYGLLEYSWYKKTSSKFQKAMQNISVDAVKSAKKNSPEYYNFNPFKYGSYSVGKRQTTEEAQARIIQSIKYPSLYKAWGKEIKLKSEFRFWKNGFIYPAFVIITFIFIFYNSHKSFPWDLLDSVSGDNGDLFATACFLALLHGIAGVGLFAYYVLHLELPFLFFN